MGTFISGEGTLWSIWTESGNALVVVLKNMNTSEHSLLRRFFKICRYSAALPVWFWTLAPSRVLNLFFFPGGEVEEGESKFSTPITLPLDETKTWETCFYSHCTSELRSIPDVRFIFVCYEEKDIPQVDILFSYSSWWCFRFEKWGSKEPSCWLKFVVVGDEHNSTKLIKSRLASAGA